MSTKLAAAMTLLVSLVASAAAQQTTGAKADRSLGAGTPGVAPGTTGTTYSAPGAEQQTNTPGGTIPMGASTQDTSNLPSSPSNFNNSAGPSGR